MANTANQYFKEACNTLMKNSPSTGTHCGDNYEIKLFHSTQYVSHIRNFLGQFNNTLRNAICEELLLPRAIVIVLDEDLIHFVNIDKFGMSLAYGRILHMFSEVNKMIAARKDMLRLKSCRDHFPEIIWINPLFHNSFRNNAQCNKFSKALDTTAAIYMDNWSLKLKRIWDPQSRDLYLDDPNRFTAKGLMTYWMAVDRTIKFWDTALSPIKCQQMPLQTLMPMPNQTHKRKKNHRYNKLFWQKKREREF